MQQPPAHVPRSVHIAQSKLAFPFVALLLAFTLSVGSAPIAAAPSSEPLTRVAAQNVDYLSDDSAQRLNLDFPVLVPSFVPAPFSGAPSVRGGGGSYTLYWMVPGDAPTFLNITGEVGGSFPDGSRDDFNNELFINATVRGVEAIHDVTSTYDDVWWISDGVMYAVQSRNMQGVDSLGLANALIDFQPPAVATEPAEEETPEPTQETPPPIDTSLPGVPPVATTVAVPTSEADPTSQAEPTAEAGAGPTATAEVPTAQATSAAEAGTTPPAEPIEASVAGGQAADGTPSANPPIAGVVIPATPGTPVAGDNPTQATSNGTPDASPTASSDGTGASLPASDGTGGAAPPIPGSDGTGGTSELSLSPVRR